jgi:alginate O-acetyltransferase complex protein AlgI
MSFFTFEFIHHAADCYFGKAEKGPFSVFLAFIFFFPTLACGPIKRFQKFEQGLSQNRFDPQSIAQAITRIAFGLAKKTVLADTFNLWAQELNSKAIYSASRLQLCAWILAYGWYIYFDFSAYSDVAIGCAKLFGIEVPENFNFPYLSRNISEFWRRWHMSLMNWLQDYVYLPVFFSKWKIFGPRHIEGYFRLSLTLLIVFLLSGLWHGGSAHFLIWGYYHAVLVISHITFKHYFGQKALKIPASMAMGLTYACVNVGYVIFALDPRDALFVYQLLLGIL